MLSTGTASIVPGLASESRLRNGDLEKREPDKSHQAPRLRDNPLLIGFGRVHSWSPRGGLGPEMRCRLSHSLSGRGAEGQGTLDVALRFCGSVRSAFDDAASSARVSVFRETQCPLETRKAEHVPEAGLTRFHPGRRFTRLSSRHGAATETPAGVLKGLPPARRSFGGLSGRGQVPHVAWTPDRNRRRARSRREPKTGGGTEGTSLGPRGIGEKSREILEKNYSGKLNGSVRRPVIWTFWSAAA
jgi:hypothetical protein